MRLAGPIKRFNYRLGRGIVRALARPTVTGAPPPASDEIVYVLPNRSLADLLLLDVVATAQALPAPRQRLEVLDEGRRFFFLNRPTGWRRRHTMRRTSARMRRIQRQLRKSQAPAVTLVPVSVFWGRAADKERSWLRSLVSESWGTSSRLRRLLGLLLSRKDVLLHFHRPLPWRDLARGLDAARAERRIARLLRVRFRNQRQATLGPDLSHRRTLIQRVLASPQVRAAIAAEAKGQPAQPAHHARARKAAFAIAANMSFPAMRVLDRFLTWFWSRIYDGVAVHGFEHVSDLAATHTLVFAPCHRSHIDYLLLSYVLHHQGLMLPHIASGDNLDLPVVGRLLRGCGAFFIRRSFRGDDIYRAVLDEYLYQTLRRGHSLEYFIEGTRSRTGRLLPPRTGMLQTTLDAVARGLPRPVAVIPVHIAYEKVIEAASFDEELSGGSKRPESVGGIFRARRLVRQEFGSVALAFAAPIEPDAYVATEAGSHRLANEILRRLNRSASINATHLVALVTLAMPRHAIDVAALGTQLDVCRELLERERNHHNHAIDWRPAHRLIDRVEELGLVRREHSPVGDVVSLGDAGAVRMTWYANNALHTLAAPALIACFVVERRGSISARALLRAFAGVAPLVANELHTHLDARTCHRCLRHMRAMGLVEMAAEGIIAPQDLERRFRTELLARILMPALERYFIASTLLVRSGSGILSRADLMQQCGATSERISRLYGSNAPEFHDARLFHGFLDALLRLGLATEDADGRLRFDDTTQGPLATALKQAEEVIPAEIRYAVRRSSGIRTER
ncbi:MAG: glycerol-3-phosphate 1-O-acyltransferase PlsB [Gammaproteobacteria bacterium]|nr:glycerol-3-phosphate 1-O-acyltransferase PlsB [Gammaproteobacteria bacterium]